MFRPRPILLLAISFSLLLSACRPRPAIPHDSLTPEDLSLIQPGDIILRRSLGVGGMLIEEKLGEKVPLTHVAIMAKKDNRWVIVQSVGGGVKKVVRYGVHHVTPEHFSEFAKEKSIVVVRLRASDSARAAIVERAWHYSNNQVPFDYRYDMDDPSGIYCTELVYLCIKDVLGRDFFSHVTVGNGKWYIPFNDFLNPEHFERIVDHTKLVESAER